MIPVAGLTRELASLLPSPVVLTAREVLPADVGPSTQVSYEGAPVPPNGGWTGELEDGGKHRCSFAEQLAHYLETMWGEDSEGLHVHQGVQPYPPIVGYNNTLEPYDEEQQRRNTIRIEHRRLASFGKYATGFTRALELATMEAQKKTGEKDLDVYDSHILRQKKLLAVGQTTLRSQTRSDGGSSFGGHRDNHDNPGSVRNGGKSQLRYSMSIILTATPTNVAPSSMCVLEPSGLTPIEYPRVPGGYVLFRSQTKHTSIAQEEGQPTFLKVVFFFKRRADVHPPGGYCDHMNRPYFDIETFMDAASYVRHRLGPHEGAEGVADVVTLADVWRTACEQMPLLVGKQTLMNVRSKRGGLEWSSGRCSSCCFGAGVVDSVVAASADKCAPRSLFAPTRFSSAEDMREQLASCTELDDMTWNMTGKVERVNATCFQQPRRKSWSVVTGEDRGNCDGKRRLELFSYSQSYRPVQDWCAAPIPRAVFELGVACWKAAWDYLSPISQVCLRSDVH